uniref:Uncharacterized protein n=1 Tax=Vitrella brassicaformis TaxID=1169539 RepID=A0A7S1JNC2_9ALVE|mmetsp:Transcript_17122/g.41128  ORF Transcript_17122/g.41128 Transcript_17122/m.41128 type:complete len:161 (+) Transcript_17122:162-644(+)
MDKEVGNSLGIAKDEDVTLDLLDKHNWKDTVGLAHWQTDDLEDSEDEPVHAPAPSGNGRSEEPDGESDGEGKEEPEASRARIENALIRSNEGKKKAITIEVPGEGPCVLSKVLSVHAIRRLIGRPITSGERSRAQVSGRVAAAERREDCEDWGLLRMSLQ